MARATDKQQIQDLATMTADQAVPVHGPTDKGLPGDLLASLQTSAAGAVQSSEVGQAGGVAGLDGAGKVPAGQLPALAVTEVYAVADIAERDALDAQEGDFAVVADADGNGNMASYAFDGAAWVELQAPGSDGTAVGTIRQAAGSPGAKWLEADGTVVAQASYPALLAELGTVADFSIGEATGLSLIPSVGVATDPNGNVMAAGGSLNDVLVSTDSGASWGTKPISQFATALRGIAFGGGAWVIVGDSGGLIRSTDFGDSWTQPLSSGQFNGIVFGGGVFVAWENSGTAMQVSTDGGASWVAGTKPDTAFADVIHDGGRFVALSADGSIYTSTDGSQFTLFGTLPTPVGSGSWGGLAFDPGAGRYVAIETNIDPGTTGAAYSDDLSSWTPVTLPSQSNWHDVVFGGGFFLAVSGSGQSDGALASSPDGVDWTARGPLAAANWGPVAHAAEDGVFLLGDKGAGDIARIFPFSYDPATQFLLPDESGQALSDPLFAGIVKSWIKAQP